MEFITEYKTLLRRKPEPIRNKVRSLALDALNMGLGLTRNPERLLERPRIQFLYIHHVFKDEEQKLDLLLRELSRHHSFISHSEAVDRLVNGKVDKPYISISSDDGLKNNLNAAAFLDRYGARGVSLSVLPSWGKRMRRRSVNSAMCACTSCRWNS